jgi:hydrogenase nickel incorporation protein HypA/HybF
MHEMPIVLNVVRSMDRYAKAHSIPEIRVVVMEIGEASGVMPFFFHSCWEPAIGKSDCLLNASLEIIGIPGEGKCNACGATFHPEDYQAGCPTCGGNDWIIVSGRDIRIKEIKIDQ